MRNRNDWLVFPFGNVNYKSELSNSRSAFKFVKHTFGLPCRFIFPSLWKSGHVWVHVVLFLSEKLHLKQNPSCCFFGRTCTGPLRLLKVSLWMTLAIVATTKHLQNNANRMNRTYLSSTQLPGQCRNEGQIEPFTGNCILPFSMFSRLSTVYFSFVITNVYITFSSVWLVLSSTKVAQ